MVATDSELPELRSYNGKYEKRRIKSCDVGSPQLSEGGRVFFFIA